MYYVIRAMHTSHAYWVAAARPYHRPYVITSHTHTHIVRYQSARQNTVEVIREHVIADIRLNHLMESQQKMTQFWFCDDLY